MMNFSDEQQAAIATLTGALPGGITLTEDRVQEIKVCGELVESGHAMRVESDDFEGVGFQLSEELAEAHRRVLERRADKRSGTDGACLFPQPGGFEGLAPVIEIQHPRRLEVAKAPEVAEMVLPEDAAPLATAAIPSEHQHLRSPVQHSIHLELPVLERARPLAEPLHESVTTHVLALRVDAGRVLEHESFSYRSEGGLDVASPKCVIAAAHNLVRQRHSPLSIARQGEGRERRSRFQKTAC
jgi:hypothetical protein